MLGNSFSKYADALTDARRGRMAEWCALVRAQPFTNETACGEEAVGKEREKASQGKLHLVKCAVP